MINTKYLLCISTCLLFSGNVQASDINLTYDSSGFLPGSFSLHTLHTPSELRPTSLFNPDNSVKLAAVCSVGGGGCSGLTFGSSGNSMNLDGAAQCDDEGYVNSCPEGQVKDESNLCPYNSSYFKCRDVKNTCDDGYSTTTCSSEQVIENSYTNEAGSTCYQCRDKTCAEGGYTDSLTSCQKGSSVSFANKTCYQDITDKNCEDLGYLSSQPENNKCTPVEDCGKFCYQDCYQPTCEDGGYKSGIPDNNICTQIDYYGNKCFDNCYQPTCDNGGYLDAQPAGQTCTPIVYYDRNCFQNDCKVNEVEIACEVGSVLYEDKKCYSSTTKTPIAVVFDTDKKLAASLEEAYNLAWGGEGTDITSLGNCTSSSTLTSCSIDGKANTATIIAFGKANSISYPAAEYCNKYTTTGTSAGEWFLPSFAELKSIYNVKSTITETLNLLGKSSLTTYYRSSIESGSSRSWTLAMYSGTGSNDFKSTGFSVRPVINYGTCIDTECAKMPTTPCSSSQFQTYTCTDCKGIQHYVCQNKCVSGGSETCTGGQLTPCSDSQKTVNGCMDCSGNTHYFCQDLSPTEACQNKYGPTFYPNGNCPSGMVPVDLEQMCGMVGSVNCCGCQEKPCPSDCSRSLQAATWGICTAKSDPTCKCPNPAGTYHKECL